MSRGLGKLQRLILLSLKPSRAWANSGDELLYIGHGSYFARPDEVTYKGERVRLGYGDYDLSAVRMFLAKKLGRTRIDRFNGGVIVNENFSSSFWRSAKRLMEDDYIEPLHLDAKRQRLVRLTPFGERAVKKLSVDTRVSTLKTG